ASLFLPTAEPRSARKSWIAGTVNPAGTVIVDDGAARALRSGKSLLPAGVVAVEGNFERGDCVIVRTRGGNEGGRGLLAYASADIERIAGHKTGEIATILGYHGRDEIIHRDDLVVSERRGRGTPLPRQTSPRHRPGSAVARATPAGCWLLPRPRRRPRRSARLPPQCARKPTRSSPPMPKILPRRTRPGCARHWSTVWRSIQSGLKRLLRASKTLLRCPIRS